MTEAALVGAWRPVSIAGYHGPLTAPPMGVPPVLSFDGRGHWGGTDGCNGMNGSYRLGTNGAFQLALGGMTQALCDRFPPTPASLRTAVQVELRDDRLTFFDREGTQIAQYERSNVVARVALSSLTMTAGSSVTGYVTVYNNTGYPLHEHGCGSLFQVALGNDAIEPDVAFPSCLETFTVPVSKSSYPVTVRATYLGCGGTPLGNNSACVTTHGHTALPPLPPGQYEAKLFQSSNIVPIPPPIAVRVTPQRSTR